MEMSSSSISLEDKLELIRLDKRLFDRIKRLSRDSGIKFDELASIVAAKGVNATLATLAIMRSYGIPFNLCVPLVENPLVYFALRKHNTLLKVLEHIPPEEEVNLGRVNGIVHPVYISAGSNAEGGRLSLYRFTDLHACFFPTPRDMQSKPELASLYKIGRGETLAEQRKGSIGHIESSFPLYGDEPVHLVVNGQARKSFWKMHGMLRRQYDGWYESMLTYLQGIASKIGIDTFMIASNELVNRSLMLAWNHTAPDSVLNCFYDRFAEKRSYSRKKVLLIHPVNKAYIEGDVWVKRAA